MHKRTALFAIGALVAQPALALYDPKPNALLTAAIGAWRGSLTYADYQTPDRLETLQTQVTVTFNGPDELALYYVFDDGPGKTVYSYERMNFDLGNNELRWTEGSAKPSTMAYRVTSASSVDGQTVIEFERAAEGGVDQHRLEINPRAWLLTKREKRAGKDVLQRSKYQFARAAT